MNIRYFVTGTGTGVGKTFVTVALARRALALGKTVFAFKPMETGCLEVGEDQEALALAAGDWQRGEIRGVYRFPMPAAPLVAAESKGVIIDLERVAAAIDLGASGRDFSIVEAVGGWRVPITPDIDVAGWATRLGWPVIIVGAAGLGTINHCLLTIESVLRTGCSIAAVVLSVLPSDDPVAATSNAAQIARMSSCSVLLSSGNLDSLVASQVGCFMWNK